MEKLDSVSMHDILDKAVLECWRHFVLACRVLLMNTISVSSIKLGDALLLQFCRRTETLFGKTIITPNMHMHCHLRQCLEDYGPLHTFWCFSFEQYNGKLGSMPNNNKAIEVQLMKKFLRDVQTSATQLPEELTEQVSELLSATITSVRAEQLVQPISLSVLLHKMVILTSGRKVLQNTIFEFLILVGKRR